MAQVKPIFDFDSMNHQGPAISILTGIVRSLVSEPDQVKVDATGDSSGSLVTIYVSESDLDIVTGAGGRTARSLRTVLNALGKRTGQHLTLEIRTRNP